LNDRAYRAGARAVPTESVEDRRRFVGKRLPGNCVSLRVYVPRSWLVRRQAGVWTCARRIAPERIQAVCVVGLLRSAAA
jgi:hypothetical protein